MIGKKFTNNLKASRPTSLFEDPWQWGIARNLAYASIRDEVEGMIKHTNENSADVFINAKDLIQNIKSKKTNQYINGGNVTQNFDLTDDEQVYQILMNVGEVNQTFNYIDKKKIATLIFGKIDNEIHQFLALKYFIVACNDKKNVNSYGTSTVANIQTGIKKLIDIYIDIEKIDLVLEGEIKNKIYKDIQNSEIILKYNNKSFNTGRYYYLFYYIDELKLFICIVDMSNSELKKPRGTDIFIKGKNPLGNILKSREGFEEKYMVSGFNNVSGLTMGVHNSLGKLKLLDTTQNKPKRKLYENALFN